MHRPSITTRVREWVIGNSTFCLTVLIQVATAAVLIASGYMIYATCDDTTMVALLSGAYGFENYFAINMHPAIGLLVSKLFAIAPIINWVTILFLLVIALSFGAVDYLLLFRREGKGLRIFTAAILIIAFQYVLGHFTFTVVSYAAVIAGVVCTIFHFDDPSDRRLLPTATLFFILSSMIRTDCLYVGLVLITFYLTARLFQKSVAGRRVLPILGIMTLTILGNFISNAYIEGKNPIQDEFRSWGEARSSTMDGNFLRWEADPQRFIDAGISQDDYLAAIHPFYFDQRALSQEFFEKYGEINPISNRFNFSPSGFALALTAALASPSWDGAFYFVTIMVVITALGSVEKSRRIPMASAILGTLLIHYGLFVIQRPLFRVVMPLYLLLCMVLLAEVKLHGKTDQAPASTTWLKALSAILVLGVSISYFAVNPLSTKTVATAPETRDVVDYLRNHQENLYLCSSVYLFSIDVNRDVFDFPGSRGELWNLMGNWEIYSYPYSRLMENYDVKDEKSLLRSSVGNDSILYMTNAGIEPPAFAINILRERYGIDAHYELVDQMESPNPYAFIRVWKLAEGASPEEGSIG